MEWCEARDVDCVLGMPNNSRMEEATGWESADAQAECEPQSRAARRYKSFPYATRKSLVPGAAGRCEGGAPSGQGQPRVRRHVVAGDGAGPAPVRDPLLRPEPDGELHQGAADGPLRRPGLGVGDDGEPAAAPLPGVRCRCAGSKWPCTPGIRSRRSSP